MDTFTVNEKALLVHLPTRGTGAEIVIPVTIKEVRNNSCQLDTEHQKGIWVLQDDLRKI